VKKRQREILKQDSITPTQLAKCECGQAKLEYAECCPRCSFLDSGGHAGSVVAEVIWALRSLGRASFLELVHATGLDQLVVSKAIWALRQKGRVEKVSQPHPWEPEDDWGLGPVYRLVSGR